MLISLLFCSGPRVRRIKKPALTNNSEDGTSPIALGEDKRPRTAFSGSQLARLKVSSRITNKAKDFLIFDTHYLLRLFSFRILHFAFRFQFVSCECLA